MAICTTKFINIFIVFDKFKEDNIRMREKLDKGKVTYEEYVKWLNGI